MKRYSKEFKEKIIDEYIKGKSSCQLEREYKVLGPTLIYWVKSSGYKLRSFSKSYSDEFKRCMVEEYLSGFTSSELSTKYKIQSNNILRWTKASGFKVRTIGKRQNQCIYNINTNFFEEINSEESAYILGFIVGDGNIHKRKNSNSYILQICISEEDKDILEKIKDAMESTHKIRKSKKMVSLSVYSKKIFNDLVNLGITPRKTFTSKPIKLRKDLQRHFWRGVIDADGCITSTKDTCGRPTPVISLSGTKEVCKGFSHFVGCNGKNVYPDKSIYTFHKNGSYALDIYNLLYKNTKIYLNRKYQQYKEIELNYKNRKMKRVPYTEEIKEKLVQKYLEGKSTYQLQKEYNMDDSTIGNWVRKSGNKMRSRGKRIKEINGTL